MMIIQFLIQLVMGNTRLYEIMKEKELYTPRKISQKRMVIRQVSLKQNSLI